MDFLTTQPSFDVMWQFAISAALVHMVLMKFPQQPDSALNFIPSSANALGTFALFLYWRDLQFAEGCTLYILFIVLFVSLSDPLLTTVFFGYHPADTIQCIFPTSRHSWIVLVHGDRYNICQEYFHVERLFQNQWSSETAETTCRIG